METSICGNCINDKNCIYQFSRQNEIRTDCDSHESGPIQSRPIVLTNSNDGYGAIGLCSSCDSKSYCSLLGPKQVILQCEHYV